MQTEYNSWASFFYFFTLHIWKRFFLPLLSQSLLCHFGFFFQQYMFSETDILRKRSGPNLKLNSKRKLTIRFERFRNRKLISRDDIMSWHSNWKTRLQKLKRFIMKLTQWNKNLLNHEQRNELLNYGLNSENLFQLTTNQNKTNKNILQWSITSKTIFKKKQKKHNRKNSLFISINFYNGQSRNAFHRQGSCRPQASLIWSKNNSSADQRQEDQDRRSFWTWFFSWEKNNSDSRISNSGISEDKNRIISLFITLQDNGKTTKKQRGLVFSRHRSAW